MDRRCFLMDEYVKTKYKILKNQLEEISTGLKNLDLEFIDLNNNIEKNIMFDKKNPIEDSMNLIRENIIKINDNINNSIINIINSKI